MARRVWRPGIGLCIAALVAATAVPAPADARARAAREFFGIVPATQLSNGEVAMMGAARVGFVRVPFRWSVIQPRPAGTDPLRDLLRWDNIDRVVGAAARYGIRVVPTLIGTPSWVAESPLELPVHTAEAREGWETFLRQAARRYGPGGGFWRRFLVLNPGVPERPVTAWQIWNEPNATHHVKPIRTAPEDYAKLVKASSRALRSTKPAAKVVLAGLFGTPPRGIWTPAFLRRFYAEPHIRRHFEALSLHPYSRNLAGIKAQFRLARRQMRQAGDLATPIWITEIGWPTQQAELISPLIKSYRGQARMLRRSFNLFLRRRDAWGIERVTWYTWRDNDVNEICSLCRFAGLFEGDLDPKPAWRAFVRFTGGKP
jgi:hypothetical protein